MAGSLNRPGASLLREFASTDAASSGGTKCVALKASPRHVCASELSGTSVANGSNTGRGAAAELAAATSEIEPCEEGAIERDEEVCGDRVGVSTLLKRVRCRCDVAAPVTIVDVAAAVAPDARAKARDAGFC